MNGCGENVMNKEQRAACSIMNMCIVVEEFWCNDVHFAILLLYPSIRKTVHVRPWMRSTFKNNPLRMKKKSCAVCGIGMNQSRNEISMSVILDFMNTAVPNCQGCRRSKGNACWTYILVFQIQLLESSQSLVTILWRSHRLIVHSYIRPETWPLECHQRTNVLPSVSNKLLQEFYLDWCDTCHEPWLPVVPNGKKRHSSSCNADLRVYS